VALNTNGSFKSQNSPFEKFDFKGIYFQIFQEDHYFVTVFLHTFFRKKVWPRWPGDDSNENI
jgi:hypothetical protein